MKTFIPGQIASAKDVNDNFAEVLAGQTVTTKTLRLHTSWSSYGGGPNAQSIGALHLVPLIVKWDPYAFDAKTGVDFPILYIPEDMPAPAADWTPMGTIHAGAYATPLVYRSSDRSIRAYPTANFKWPLNWSYGTAIWIA